ncbi:MAG: hypothetical protein IPN30_06500 [Flavobacteriales bacterium]|nr:hypothetical protein [Flavobacteriales bacterium]
MRTPAIRCTALRKANGACSNTIPTAPTVDFRNLHEQPPIQPYNELQYPHHQLTGQPMWKFSTLEGGVQNATGRAVITRSPFRQNSEGSDPTHICEHGT